MLIAPELVELHALHAPQAPGGFHAWYASLDVDQSAHEALVATLSDEERARAGGYPAPVRGRRFARGRAVLRVVLSGITGVPVRQLAFSYNADGKPSLVGDSATSGVHFNVSHARDLLVVGVSTGRPVGVDLSRAEGSHPIERVAERFFSAPEKAALAAESRDADRRARFTRIWVRKEAWLKGVGAGISPRIYDTDFSAPAGEQAETGASTVLSWEGWRLFDLHGLPAGYLASAAVALVQG